MAKTEDAKIRKSRKYKRKLPVPIDPKAIAAKERKIRKNLSEIMSIEAKLKPDKDRQRNLRDENKQLTKDADAGSEEKDVDCISEFNDDSNETTVIRLDTNEVVETRTMTADEMQVELKRKRGDADALVDA